MKVVVTTIAMLTTVSATAFAQSSGVTPDCAPAWGRYAAAPGPKAFANGSKRGCGWQIKNDAYPTAQAIRAQALRQCAQEAGAQGGCRVVSEQK
jgi:hypothetical protein